MAEFRKFSFVGTRFTGYYRLSENPEETQKQAIALIQKYIHALVEETSSIRQKQTKTKNKYTNKHTNIQKIQQKQHISQRVYL